MSKCGRCDDEIKVGERAAWVGESPYHAACACSVLAERVAELEQANKHLRSLVTTVGSRSAAASHGIFRVAR
jgi:hypothetical protein